MSNLHLFNSMEGRIDESAGVIRGVALITLGEARGHNLVVDGKTLEQLKESMEKTAAPGIKAKLNHRSGVEAVFGYINNFNIEGDKLTGDLNMLKHHKDYNQTMEQIATLPGQIGLSVAFQGDKEPGKDGKTYARCKRIVSVDLVPDPAANPNGLFESKVDKDTIDMETENPSAEELLASINNRLDGVENFQTDLQDAIADQLTEEDDDGYEYEEEGYEDDGDYEEEAAYDDGYDDEAEYADVEEELEPVEYSSIDDALTYLEAKAEGALQAEQEVEEDLTFGSIEDKVVELSERYEELELENQALRDALELEGVEPVSTSSEDHLFGVNAGEGTFEFAIQQAASEADAPHEAIMDAVVNSPSAHRQWMVEQGILEGN